LAGETITVKILAAVIRKSADAVVPPVAEMLAKPVAGTPRVVTVNVADV
jgi:hypothetical protein